jgi:hypothetical protein
VTLLVRGASGDEVSRGWEGKKAVCIASGPSLTDGMLRAVKEARERDECRVIVVNDMYLVAPWADVLYFADGKWWNWHKAGVAKSWSWAKFSAQQVRDAFTQFPGQKVTIWHPAMAKSPELFVLKNDGQESLSNKPNAIRTGSNSGYQALNISVLSGANPIVLLGYDMRFEGTRSHSHNGHETRMGEPAYNNYAKRFVSVQNPLKSLGVKVLNCSPGSKITAFPIVPLEEALRGPSV